MDIFSIVAILLGLTALFGYLNERYLHLQPTIGLMLLALLTTVGLGVLKRAGVIGSIGWEETLVRQLDLSTVLLNGVLCFMLFAGSIGVRLRALEEQRWLVLALAVGSTLLGCLLVGLTLSAALGVFGIVLPLPYAFVFGALITPTDPIAALAILKSAGLPKPIETVINGESLFNDGVGVVLFTVALGVAQGTEQQSLAGGVALFLREVVGGVVLGLVVSAVAHHMLMRSKEFANHLLVTLSTVAFGYAVALHAEVSGPIAMVVAGLVVGNYTAPRLPPRLLDPLATFWNGIDDVLNSLLFAMIGLVVIMVHDLPAAPLAISIPVAILVCLAARAVSVYVPIAILNATPRLDADSVGMTKLLTWGGLRGGLALALAMSLPADPAKAPILNMTFGVVAFSILVQGTTVGKLFKPADLERLMKPR